MTYSPTIAVPSALAGLTSLFGMGRGGPCRYNHHKAFIRRRLVEGGFNFIKRHIRERKYKKLIDVKSHPGRKLTGN